MKTEAMKELYETGKWICVTRFPWQEWAIHTNNIVKFIRFDGKLLEYKLVHVRHRKFLIHALNGGRVYFCMGLNKSLINLDDFIKYYHKDNEYRIIIEEKPKLVESITSNKKQSVNRFKQFIYEIIKDGDWEYSDGSPTLSQDAEIFIEYIERIQKDN